ncbi:hypothetical protein [Rugosimonospora africana]|uniref:Uncharacterized protein n=1 Tax=Rugosimonospora africana TaxID=556532 RepID=A0A8J3QM85_9ACTN|nr:hypothetical protein [Rugosimonospora africana]GIH12142.1 hypothetical protein Raf01_03140 [Rugosimonospora africana]
MTPHGVGTAIIVTALLAAAWCLVTTLRKHAIGIGELIAMGVVQALVMAQIVISVVHLAQGQRPQSLVTFVGYLVAIFVILPAAGVLARLEPTRWGALIATIGCAVVAVLIVRLNQVWTGVG